jgi:hypothetical protein
MFKNEVMFKNVPDAYEQLNYKELFKTFAKLRKIKLLRYIFD